MAASMLAFLEGPDLIIVIVLVLLSFGSSQLPKLARSLGQAKKELDAGLREGESGAPRPTAEANKPPEGQPPTQ